MSLPEILLIIVAVAFVVGVFGRAIYKRIKHQPTDECACCAMKNKRMLKKMKKDVQKEINAQCCCKK